MERPQKQTFQRTFVLYSIVPQPGRLAQKGIFHKVCLVQSAQNAQVQFLCKTAFANSRQAGYNNFVQRVALMRKTGCMRAARCFLFAPKWKGKGESHGKFQSVSRHGTHRQADAKVCDPVHYFRCWWVRCTTSWTRSLLPTPAISALMATPPIRSFSPLTVVALAIA